MPASRSLLRHQDYTSLLRLLGELDELPDNPALRCHHAADALCRILNARSAMLVRAIGSGPDARVDGVAGVGLSHVPPDLLVDYFAGRVPFDPAGLRMHEPSAPQVAARRQLIDDDAWYRNDHFEAMRRPLEVDDALYSSFLTPDGQRFGLALLRSDGERPFSERQTALLLAFVQHGTGHLRLRRPAWAGLALRLQPVAERLLAGDSIKMTAYRLGLSPHTVNQYAKVIYRELNVSSRSELMLKLLGRETLQPPRDS